MSIDFQIGLVSLMASTLPDTCSTGHNDEEQSTSSFELIQCHRIIGVCCNLKDYALLLINRFEWNMEANVNTGQWHLWTEVFSDLTGYHHHNFYLLL